MTFKWSEIKKPVFILAPMAEITTLPFRSICREMGADIVFTPMLSSNAIAYNPDETLKIAEFMPITVPAKSTNGPPLFPGLIEASVCIILRIGADESFSLGSIRLRALTTPTDTVCSKSSP